MNVQKLEIPEDYERYENINENNEITSPKYVIDSQSDEESQIRVVNRYFWKVLCYLLKYAYDYLIIVLCVIFYELSLEGCFKQMEECVTIFDAEQIHKRILRNLAISALFFTIQILLMIHKINLNLTSILVTSFTFVFLIILRDSGTDLKYHGAYNRVVFIIFVVAYAALFYILKSIKQTFNNEIKKGLIVLSVIFTLLVIMYITIRKRFVGSCDGWDEGFKGVKIDNTKTCKILTPNICYQNLLNGYLDLSSYLSESCDTRRNDLKENLLSHLKNPKANVIGYPRAESYDYLNKGHYQNFQNNVMKELVDMQDPNVPQKIKDKVEVTITFTENPNEKDKTPGIAKIELKKETEVAEKRKEIFEKEYADKVLSRNLLIFFIDSVSRVHFKRKLPKTWKWLEKFYKPDKGTTHENFQFLKYHGVGTWTNVNMIPAMFGVAYDSYTYSTYFAKHFQKMGYITGSAGTMCSRELIDLDNSMVNFDWASYDHELYSFFCDPNFTPVNNPFPILNGPYSIRKKCLYGKSTAEYAIDYTNQFFEAYKEYPKLFRIDIIDQHEGTGEVVKYDDELIYNFFVDFENKGFMKDTMIIVMSDHNYNMPGPYSLGELEDWKKELTLPFLNILLEKNMKNFYEIKENLVYNENVMVNPYDLHSTTLSILSQELSKTKQGKSLFHEKFSLNPEERSCKQMKIKQDWCRCSEEYA